MIVEHGGVGEGKRFEHFLFAPRHAKTAVND
jgi:hypothetical protein